MLSKRFIQNINNLSTLFSQKTGNSFMMNINTYNQSITMKSKYSYHISYLMDSKNDQKYVKIQKRAFHIYKQCILNEPFHEKKLLIVLIDCVRTKQSFEDFQDLVQFTAKNVDKITQPLSIFTISAQLYNYNYKDKQNCLILAKKGFQFFRNQKVKMPSYHMMRFLIFIQKCVGLHNFTDQQYSVISFDKFKPLFLCFTLELFSDNQLQGKYKTIDNVLQLFLSREKLIPFADVHHYCAAARKLKNPRITQFVAKLIKQDLNTKQEEISGQVVAANQQNKYKKVSSKSLFGQSKVQILSKSSQSTSQFLKDSYERQVKRRFTLLPF